MSDERKTASASVEERAQSREELINVLIESEDWAGLDAMTNHLSSSEEERAEQEASVLVRHLLASLKGAKNDGAKARLRYLIGQIYHRVLKDPNLAVSNYRLAVQSDPTLADAFRAGAQLYADHDRQKAAYQLKTLEHAVVKNPERLTELLVELIELADSALGDQTASYRWAMKLEQLHPAHPVAIEVMERLEGSASESAVRFSATIEESKALRDRKARATFLFERAQEWHRRDANDPWTVEVLLELLKQDSRNAAAHDFLEQIFAERELWLELGQYLGKRLAKTPRKSDKVELLKRLADLAVNHLADADQACQWFRQILKLDPLDRDALNFCVDHYSQIEDWQELVAVYEAALRTRQRGGEESAMLIQIALTLWKKMGDWERAEGYFRRIKLSEPKHSLMLKFYEAYYQHKGDHRRLLSVLSTQQTNEDSIDEKIAVGLRMAEVAEKDLGSNEKAIDVYRSILKLDPDQEEARERLPSLFVATRKWNALLEHLKDELNRLPGTDAPAQLDVLNEIVQVYRDRLRLPAMVIATYQQILDVDPTHLEANEALESTFRKSGRWNDLIGLLTRRVERLYEQGENEQSALLSHEIARLWIDKFSNHAQAAQHLERIIEINSDDIDSLAMLIEIYEQRHDWSLLFDALQKKSELVEDEERIETIVRMAQLAVQRLDMVDEGIDLWRIVRDERPEQGETALFQLLERHERYDELADLYLERLATLSGAQRVVQLKELVPLLSEKLGDEERAEEALNDILETDPNDLYAEAKLREKYVAERHWDGLETLYGSREKWHALLSVLSACADDAVDEVESADLLMRMARVCEDALDNTDAAMECWERLFVQQPDNRDAISVLSPYYESQGRWQDFANLLEAAAELDGDDNPDTFVRLAQVYSDELKDPKLGLEYLLRALRSLPKRVDLLELAQRIGEQARAFEEVFEVAIELIDQVDDEELAYLRLITEFGARHLERLEETVPYFERILELDPADVSAVNSLCSIYEKLGRWDELQSAYERALEFVTGSARETELLVSLAHLSADVLGDAEGAKQAYQRILESDEQNLTALQGLEAIAIETSDYETIEYCLKGQIPIVDDEVEVAHLRERLARLYVDRQAYHQALDEIALAATVRGDATSIQACLFDLIPTEVSEEAGQLLERLLIETNAHPSLLILYEMLIDRDPSVTVLGELHEKLGTLQQEKLNDPPAALASLIEALVLRPADEMLLERVNELAIFTENMSALRGAYERLAIGGDEVADEPQLALDYSERLAQLLDVEFDDLDGVRRVLEEIAVLHGDTLPRLAQLEDCVTRQEDWFALADVKGRQIAVAGDGVLKLDMLRELAVLSEEQLNDEEAAYDAWRTIENIKPLDPEAVDAMVRILEAGSDWSRLCALYERRYAALSKPEPTLGIRLVQLSMLSHDYERAFTVLSELAENGFRGEILPTLSSWVLDAETNGVEDDVVRHGVELLASCQGDEASWPALRTTLELLLRLTEEPEQRIDVRLRLASILVDQLEDLAEGCRVAAEGLMEDGASEPLFQILCSSGEEVLNPQLLSDYFRGAIDSDAGDGLSPSLRRSWLEQSGEALRRMNADELALPFVVERSDLDPDNVSLLEQIASIQARLGDSEGRREVLERQFELTTTPHEKLNLGTILVTLLLDELQDSEEALRITQVLVEELDDTPRALVALVEDKLTDGGQYLELAELYELVASRIGEAEARCDYLVRASDVFASHLSDMARAASLLETALETEVRNLELLQRLEGLYESESDSLSQLNAAERQLACLKDEDRAEVHFRIGQLCAETLHEFERAVDAFEQAIKYSETRGKALKQLGLLLGDEREALRTARLICSVESDDETHRDIALNALEYLRNESDDKQERIQAGLRYASLIEERDPHAAFGAVVDAYRFSGGILDVEVELERLAVASENEQSYLAELVEMAEANAERAVEIFVKAAAFAELNLNDAEGAISYYGAILELEPAHPIASEGLEYLLEGQGNYPDLAQHLISRAGTSSDSLERHQYLGRAAEILETELGDHEGAIAIWRDIYEADPSANAFEALERLYRASEAWHEILVLCSDRAQVADEEMVASLFVTIIEIIVYRLEDGEGALETIESALEISEDEALFGYVLDLFSDRDTCESIGLARASIASLILPRIPEDNAELLSECYLAQGDGQEDGSEGQIEAFRLASQQLLRLNRDAESFELGSRCFTATLAETDAEHLRQFTDHNLLEQWYQLLGDHVSEERVEIEQRIRWLFELAALADVLSLSVPEQRRWLTEVLELRSGEKRAQDELLRSYRREQEWETLVFTLLDFVETEGDDDEKLQFLFEACQLTEEVLTDAEQALSLWYQVVSIDAENTMALAAIERLLRRLERFDELVEHYRERIESADATEAQPIRHLAAVVELEQLHRVDEGVEFLVANLASGGIYEASLSYLEEMLSNDAFETFDVEIAIRLLTALGEVYAETERWSDWVISQELLATRVEDVDVRVTLLLSVFQKQREVESDEVAFDTLKRIFYEHPEHPAAYEQMVEYSEQNSLQGELCDILEDVLEDQAMMESAEAYLRKLHDLYFELGQLEFFDRIKHVCVRLLEFEASERSALETLIKIHEDAEEWAECISWRTRLSEQSDNEDELLRTQLDLAEYYANARDLAGQFDALRAAFELEPSAINLLDQMVEIRESQDDLEGVVELVRERVSVCAANERVQGLLRLGELLTNDLDRPEDAVETLEEYRDELYSSPQLCELYESILSSQAAWDALASFYEERLADVGGSELRDSLTYKLASIYALELERDELALEHLVSLLDSQVHRENAVAMIRELIDRPEIAMIAYRELEGHFMDCGDVDARIEIMYQVLKHVDEDDDRLVHFQTLSELLVERDGPSIRSFQALAQAFLLDPNDDSRLEILSNWSDELELSEAFVEVLETVIEGEVEPQWRLEYVKRLARKCHPHESRKVQSIGLWQEVLLEEEFNEEALNALDEIYTANENWTELIDVLSRLVEVTPQERVGQIRVRYGRLLENFGADESSAVEQHLIVLSEDPTNGVAISELERLMSLPMHREQIAQALVPVYRERKDYAKLSEVLERQAEGADDIERARLLRESGLLLLHELQQQEGAEERLLASYRLDPTSKPTFRALMELAQTSGAIEQFAEAIEFGLSYQEEDSEKTQRILLADWYQGPLEDLQRAEEHLRVVVELSPKDSELLGRLRLLLEESSRWSDIIELIRQQIDEAETESAQVELLMEAASIAESYLEDTTTAIDFYRQAFTIDPHADGVFERLEGCLVSAGDMDALAALIEDKIAQTYENEHLMRLYDSGAELYAHELDRPADAIRLYELRLELEIDSEVMMALHGLYRQVEQWERLSESLQTYLDSLDDENELQQALAQLIDVAHDELKDLPLFQESCERWLNYGFDLNVVFERLESLFRDREDWTSIIELYERAAADEEDPERQCELRQKLVDLYLDQRDDVEAASLHLERVIQTRESPSSKRLLAQLRIRQGDHDQGAEILRSLSEEDGLSAQDLGRIKFDLGKLLVDVFGEFEEGISLLEAGFEIDGSPQTLQYILEATESHESSPAYVRALENACAIFEGEKRLAVLRSLAAVRISEGLTAQSIPILQQILKVKPDDHETIEQYLEVHESLERTDEIVDNLQGWVESFGNRRLSGLTARVSGALGRIYQRRGDDEKAIELFKSVTRLDSSNVANLIALGSLYRARGDWYDASQAMTTALLHQEQLDDEKKCELFRHLGEVREEMGEMDKAAQMYRRVLALAPNDDLAKKRLERLREV